MEQIYITELHIEKVRHLRDVWIPVSENGLRHLILTGKNGSGKTSVLDALSRCIEMEVPDAWMPNERDIMLKFNYSMDTLHALFKKGKYIAAYYKAEREFQAEVPKHIEKVELRDRYLVLEHPSKDFIKYLRDLNVTEALALKNGKTEKSMKIQLWFQKFQELLRQIFHDETLRMEFDDDTFSFTIYEEGKEPFDFNTLSSGYAAILDIVADLMIRMEKQTDKTFDFYMPGIVLIDEIETHLHLELQKEIMHLLTTIFPNIQFIVSTHSPFILNSLENAVIYDLEKKVLVENGLSDVPYDGIVEGYFSVDKLSDSLKRKFERYRELTHKITLSEDDLEEISRLEMYLDEIPDYLALEITTEYQRLKLEFEAREDLSW